LSSSRCVRIRFCFPMPSAVQIGFQRPGGAYRRALTLCRR
jgi:hypothetical protein